MSPATTLHKSEVLPPRAVLFLGIVAAHVLLVYFLGNNLIRTFVKFIDPQPVKIIPVDPPTDRVAPPENLNPTLPEPVYPDPDVPQDPTYSEPDAITTSVGPQIVGPAGGPAVIADPLPIRLVGRNVIPNSESYYPAQERRLGREGTAEVQACVSAQGVLSSTPTVQHSSGRASFDQAAVRLVGDGRFARAMRGDEPVPNCYRFRVTFSMQ